MKLYQINRIVFSTLVLIVIYSITAVAQKEKKALLLGLRYFSSENKLHYLQVHTQTKVDRKIELVKEAIVNVYMNEESENGFLGKVSTNEQGDARVIIPPSMKAAWDSINKHTFIAVAEAGKDYSDAKTEIEITKAKLQIDTLLEDSTRSVIVMITEFNGTDWIPAKDVEMRVTIRRLGGYLPVSEEETYTTDSTGRVTAEFTRDSLPGDEKGMIVLVARVEDNEQYGNLSLQKAVPWGYAIKPVNDYNERTLWATRYKTPVWLLSMAYFIMAAVWGVIVYLIILFIRMRKLGKALQPEEPVPAM